MDDDRLGLRISLLQIPEVDVRLSNIENTVTRRNTEEEEEEERRSVLERSTETKGKRKRDASLSHPPSLGLKHNPKLTSSSY